ncbi:glycosyltransferase family 2 protein [Phaeobacter inhibens]|uniref:glycosyltransferase family 2 protein n=1 Tax=Phaeobacter inhibens TaxID=221822 RepID=UPI0009718A64|nr:glycosyltransferase family 2 protein [Phaeobacter inhibens]APX16632.1 glycosyl transferase [Phaeobacter inhibens]AUQ52903.1 putative glycosyl transferase [Phaeobacter inhibens]AUQ76920.1 putative glycosyl transferase [Phaeobacter inhibens]AUR02210.1 putative glycosyl transferase [Phaeobacter inhibens]AUR14079.1 putative glycosyl transferase [Phaeobacter inhibens]
MTKTISIVIPTFNRADMLPKAIDCALNQTVPCEVIVSDHGSIDHTAQVAAEYGDKITYIRREKDFGPHFCWLEGVLHATGEFVHLQYDDDWIAPTFIEKCTSVLKEDVGFAFTGAEVIDDKTGKQMMVQFLEWLPETGIFDNRLAEENIVGSLISPGAALFRRQVLIDALYQGRLPLQSSEYHGVGPDIFASLLSMLRYPKVGFVKEPLASFRAHDGSITIDALKDKEKAANIAAAYNEVRHYYVELKAMQAVRGAQT